MEKLLESGPKNKMSYLNQIANLSDVTIEKNADLTKYSTMKLVAKGDLVTVTSVESLIEIQKIFKKNNISPRIIGMGANQLLPVQNDSPYLILKFPFDKESCDELRDEYIFPASVRLSTLTSMASKFGLLGWESFTGVPASLGGAIVMNAGTNLGEIGPLVTSVKYVNKDGEICEHIPTSESFSYRHCNFLKKGDIIIQVSMKHFGVDAQLREKIKNYLDLRNKTQPMSEKTCGCIFKNSKGLVTCRAGMFIDIMGLKGLTYKGVRVSNKHANFMENFGASNYEDVVKLIEIVKSELKLQYGVDFETEVKID